MGTTPSSGTHGSPRAFPAAALSATAERLRAAGCVAAEEEAEELLTAAPDARVLEAWLTRREQGEPLAWITGGVRFAGRWLEVVPPVYVPRAQTEELARRAATRLPDHGRALDLCAGAGAVAAHLQAEVPTAFVVGVELERNAARCAARNGVRVLVGDLDDPIHGRRPFDLVTAVPPYVPTGELRFLPTDVQRYEPRAALDGGPDGLELARRIVLAAGRLLRPGGWLLVELGGEQDRALEAPLAASSFGELEPWYDEDGELRGLEARAEGLPGAEESAESEGDESRARPQSERRQTPEWRSAMVDQEDRSSGPLSEAGLERFDQVAESYVGDDKVPGLVALVARGDEVHVRARGTLAIGGGAVRRDSLFRIASITKPVTGAATLALADEGLLGLDDPIGRWLPELASPRVLAAMEGPLDDTVPAHRPITVRDLLTFTFGFGQTMKMFLAPEPWPVVRAANELQLATLGPPSPGEQPDPDVWIERLGSLPLLSQPGERWLYNTGASVLGVLLARAAHMPFADVLRTRVFGPLGMHDTAFFAGDAGRLATAYRPTPAGLQVWDTPDGQWSKPPAFCDGAGGLVSTADDLLAFARMLLRGGEPVLSAGAAREITTDQLTAEQRSQDSQVFLDGRSWSFCQSVIIEGPRTGAFGWDGGLGTSFLVDPNRDLTMIVLTQRLFGDPQPPQVHQDLQAAAYAAAG